MSAIINNDESSEGGDNNAILHSNLMRGTLQIKATEIDIRRSDDETVMHKLSGISSPIETDYILEVQSTNKVKFDNESKSRLSTQSQQVQELEKYHISKRYVDMRHLASAMRSHAEDIVRYYEVSKVLEELPSSKGSKTSSVTSGGGHHHKRTSSGNRPVIIGIFFDASSLEVASFSSKRINPDTALHFFSSAALLA